jgi:hypothetical protein
MNFTISNYLLGSIYVLRSIFRFSNFFSNYLVEKKYIDLPLSKIEKIDECIFSSLHGIVSSSLAALSLKGSIFDNINPLQLTVQYNQNDNQLQLFTSYFCLSYFSMDLLRCIYHKKYMFVMHHMAAILLLLSGLSSLSNQENKGFYIMHFIFLLESNTFLLNVGYILKECKLHYSITCTSWILHLLLFVLFRLIILPRLIIIYYLNEGLTLTTLYQLPNFLLILAGSTYWSYRQLIGIQKYLKENSVI